jgi:hypothetical protein
VGCAESISCKAADSQVPEARFGAATSLRACSGRDITASTPGEPRRSAGVDDRKSGPNTAGATHARRMSNQAVCERCNPH